MVRGVIHRQGLNRSCGDDIGDSGAVTEGDLLLGEPVSWRCRLCFLPEEKCRVGGALKTVTQEGRSGRSPHSVLGACDGPLRGGEIGGETRSHSGTSLQGTAEHTGKGPECDMEKPVAEPARAARTEHHRRAYSSQTFAGSLGPRSQPVWLLARAGFPAPRRPPSGRVLAWWRVLSVSPAFYKGTHFILGAPLA